MTDIIEKINQICRVCLLEQSIMFSIIHKTDLDLDVSQMIMDLTRIKIDLNDNLPQLLCSSCLERLRNAYSFKQDCERSDQTLRKLILENENQFDTKKFIPHNILLQNKVENQADNDFETRNVSEFVKVEVDDEIVAEKAKTIKIEQVEYEEDSHLLKGNDGASGNESHDSLNLAELKEKIIDDSKTEQAKEKIVERRKKDKKDLTKYECPVCKKIVNEHEYLWRHRKRVHLFFRCYICWKSFSNLVSLHEHDEEHEDKTYICNQENCEQEFKNLRLFILHRKNEHSIEKYLLCSECDLTFARHKPWHSHIQKHIYNRYRCELCQVKFTTENEFEDHINGQHPDYLTCSTCSKRCTDKKSFDQHVETHSTFMCEECGKEFKRKNTLNEHIKYRHLGVLKKKNKNYIEKSNHLCPVCGVAYKRPSLLQHHMQRHAGVKAFACKQCDHRTNSKHSLDIHMRTHTGERPFICDICGKGFAFKNYLSIHKRWHTGYRPYKCSFESCDKGFTTKQDLKVHERSHTGVKLFQCQICDSSFTTLHYLKVHTAKHGDSGNSGKA